MGKEIPDCRNCDAIREGDKVIKALCTLNRIDKFKDDLRKSFKEMRDEENRQIREQLVSMGILPSAPICFTNGDQLSIAAELMAVSTTPNAGGNATERSEGRVDHNVGRHTEE